MKYILLILALASTNVIADQYVNGYVKRDGTYVDGHFKSNNNGYKYDNYSTQGNVNPYTGKPGTIDPYKIDGSNVPKIPDNFQLQYGNQYGR